VASIFAHMRASEERAAGREGRGGATLQPALRSALEALAEESVRAP
jgi:hypothetical protein